MKVAKNNFEFGTNKNVKLITDYFHRLPVNFVVVVGFTTTCAISTYHN